MFTKIAGATAVAGAVGFFCYYSLNGNGSFPMANSRVKRGLEGLVLDDKSFLNFDQDDFDFDGNDASISFDGFSDDDVFMFQNRGNKGGNKKNNQAKKFRGLTQDLQESMDEFHSSGWKKTGLLLQSDGVELAIPKYNPRRAPEFLYPGFDSTNEFVEDVINDYKCSNDGADIWQGKHGPVEVTILIPSDPVLNANGASTVNQYGDTVFNGPITEYAGYTNFVNTLLNPAREANNGRGVGGGRTRLNLATYAGDEHKLIFRGKLSSGPWKTLDNALVNQLSYPKVAIKTRQGKKQIAINTVNYPRIAQKYDETQFKKESAESTPTNSMTSVLIWLISTPPNMKAFHENNELHEAISSLRKKATVIPVGIGIDQDTWDRFMVQWFPERSFKYARDSDFASALLVDKIGDLSNANFITNLNQFLCLTLSRGSCRIVRKGEAADVLSFLDESYLTTAETTTMGTSTTFFTTSTTEGTTTTDNGFRGIDEFDYDGMDRPELVPNMCCGHDMFRAEMYDNEYQKCCPSGMVVSVESDRC